MLPSRWHRQVRGARARAAPCRGPPSPTPFIATRLSARLEQEHASLASLSSRATAARPRWSPKHAASSLLEPVHGHLTGPLYRRCPQASRSTGASARGRCRGRTAMASATLVRPAPDQTRPPRSSRKALETTGSSAGHAPIVGPPPGARSASSPASASTAANRPASASGSRTPAAPEVRLVVAGRLVHAVVLHVKRLYAGRMTTKRRGSVPSDSDTSPAASTSS